MTPSMLWITIVASVFQFPYAFGLGSEEIDLTESGGEQIIILTSPTQKEESELDESAFDISAIDESTIFESELNEPAINEFTINESASHESTIEGTANDESTTDESTTDESKVDESATDESKVDESKIDESKAAQVHHTNCSFQDHFCNPSAEDLLSKIEDQEVKFPTECRNICIGDPDCKFFTYFNFRQTHSCYTLKSCNERKPMCTVPGTCVSGMKSCQNQIVCPQLDHRKGEHARWRCDGINPYKEDIPVDTACHTSCPSWRNAAGQLITAKSTCQSDGSWSDPVAFPPGPLYFPPSLQKPDNPDMGCHCMPLNITYNPNLEDGAEFFCNPEIDWNNLPAKIDTNTQCNLLCDRMLVAITECKEGLWTGRPDLGFWCSHQKDSVGNWVDE